MQGVDVLGTKTSKVDVWYLGGMLCESKKYIVSSGKRSKK